MNCKLETFIDTKNTHNIENFKIFVVGDTNSGKTSAIKKFVQNRTNIKHTLPTIGIDIFVKDVNIFFHKIKYTFYDISGDINQNKFIKTVFNKKKFDFVLIFFDASEMNSFTNIEKYWLNLLKYNTSYNKKIIIVKNVKEHTNIVVSDEDILKLINKYSFELYDLEKKSFYFNMIDLAKNYSQNNLTSIVEQNGSTKHKTKCVIS